MIGFLAVLGANLPGHLSYDSVAQLFEGRFHVRNTWGPPVYARLLGFFDHFMPGTALYVAASGLLFFGSLASLPALRGRTSWLAAPAAALVLLTPQVIIYQGIVWKDVMFANCAIGSLVCLAQAARDWSDVRRRWLFLAGALALLALGSDVRQNGVIAAILACVALGWIAAQGRWLRGATWGLCGLVAVVAAAKTLDTLSIPKGAEGAFVNTGVRIVQNYDLMGAAAFDPSYGLPLLVAADAPDAHAVLSRAKTYYSGRRVDFIDQDPVISRALNQLPAAAVQAQWFDLIFKHPALYLRVRWEDFRWLLLDPVIDWCLPVYVGIDAPANKMEPLGLAHRYTQSDVELVNYASWFLDTPVFSHAAYVALSLILAGLFLWRRQPQDIAMAALQLAAAAFASSFFIISLACDYRYLYFTDLAALTGLIYAAVDPPRPWRRGS